MLSGKSQAATAPTAMGSLLQASTYGAAIPTIYGMTQSPLLAIWAANLRQGGSIKKFKQLKKGITAYVENIDFLIGKNPIIGVNQMWNNGGTIPLNFISASISGTAPYLVEKTGNKYQIGCFAPSGGGPCVPDPNFYSVIGVTISQTYSVTFNDYGGTGPQTFSGTYQVPLWNELVTGPDPTHGSAPRNYPYCYRWEPSYGGFFYIDAPDFFTSDVFVYYTQVTGATSFQGPLLHNRLAFENELGSGTEYANAGLSAQQIIYPMFAGIESSSIDLGASGALPLLQAEVQGKFGLYPTGDADFADMIEDVFKSGVAQAAIGASSNISTTQVEHGLSCYSYPGLIQIKHNGSVEAFTRGPQTYNMPVTAGNYLIAICTTLGIGGSTVSISDSASNTWTPLFAPSFQNAWYAKANASGPLTVTFGGLGYGWGTCLLEVGGVDTLDSIALSSRGTATVTTTNTAGQPGYLLSVALYHAGGFTPSPIPQWNEIDFGGIYNPSNPTPGFGVEERTVTAPGNYSLTLPTGVLIESCIISFKGSNPPSYPKPVGDFIDTVSLDLVRKQCRANSIYGSLAMTSQKAASDWLKDLYAAADAAPVWAGFNLYSMPYSEVSAVGNGLIYNAPTAPGPSFNLSTANGDFIDKKSGAPVTITTAARVNQPNVLQMQCINRTSNYNPSVVEQPDAASISLFGIRKADPIVNNAVQDVSIARQLLAIAVRKLQYGGDVITFSLPAKWCLLAPMGAGGGPTSDAVLTVSDPLASIFNLPVRITSMTEHADMSMDCVAEPFVYGMYAPSITASISGTDTPTPYQPNPNGPVGGGMNAPLIFEATPRLAHQTSPAQIWCVTSSSAPNYGGNIPYISTDGGASYNPVSNTPTTGSAPMGVLTADFPSASDPDTTNNLFVNLAESLQQLASYSATQRDKFQFPAYIGWPPTGTAEAKYTVGDTTQITSLGVLFSNPLVPALPPGASIVNIFPILVFSALPADPTVVSSVYDGTGMTPTSGGTLMGTATGPIGPQFNTDMTGIGSSLITLASAQIRYAFSLPTTGGIASLGIANSMAWAIYYSSANPYPIDPNYSPPFNDPPPPGFGWAFAVPQTVSVGTVGTGTNATISASPTTPPAGIGYELISYNDATLISPNNWEIMATGTGNAIRRGVYGAPTPAMGMDHPEASPFAFLPPSDTGLVKINMDPAWVGTQLWFKFLQFNAFGSVLQSLTDAPAYPYTPTGKAGNIGPATGGILVNGS